MILRIGYKVRNKTLLPQWECIATSMGVIGVFRVLITPSVGVCSIRKYRCKQCSVMVSAHLVNIPIFISIAPSAGDLNT